MMIASALEIIFYEFVGAALFWVGLAFLEIVTLGRFRCDFQEYRAQRTSRPCVRGTLKSHAVGMTGLFVCTGFTAAIYLLIQGARG